LLPFPAWPNGWFMVKERTDTLSETQQSLTEQVHQLQRDVTRLQELTHVLATNQYSSLLDIQGWSDMPRGVPLFESIFVFENLPGGGTYQATKSSAEFHEDRGVGSNTGYPLTVLVNPGQRLGVQVVYDRARFDGEAIRRLLVHLQMLLEKLPADAEAFVSRLSPLTHVEREQILVQWNDTAVPSAPASIQKRFEAQVELTPDAAAVIFDGQQLSYRELNRRANQLVANLNNSIDKLNSGQGTLGQLLINQQLYDSLNGATREAQSLLKDIRANPKKFLRIKLGLF